MSETLRVAIYTAHDLRRWVLDHNKDPKSGLTWNEMIASAAGMASRVDQESRRAIWLDTVDRILGFADSVVREMLLDGEWIASALESPDAPRRGVPHDHWAFLTIDYERGSATGGNLAYYGLRFARRSDLPQEDQEAIERANKRPQPIEPKPASEYRTGARGRPGSVYLAVDEFKRRAADGRAEPTIVAEARALQKWLKSAHPTLQTPTVKAIRNRLTGLHAAYRARLHEGPK